MKKEKLKAALLFGMMLFARTLYAQKPAPLRLSQKDANVIEEGKSLVAKSDCLTCHKTDVKLIGPSYAEVARRYAPISQSKEILTEKIIKGGSGNWGQVPMNPHPDLSPADAKKMVLYILSVKS